MKTLHSWLTTISCVALVATIGCGGDEDAPNPCPSGQHGCGQTAFNLNEGGELRLELYYLPDGSVATGAHAFFFANQMPARRELPTRATELAPECYDVSSGEYIDNGNTPKAQMIAATRTYLDVGAQVTFEAISGGDPIPLAKTMDGVDPTNVMTHHLIYLGSPDASIVRRGAGYRAVIPGSDQFAARIFEDPTIYVPADFVSLSPAFPPPGGMPIEIHAGQDFTVTWTPSETELDHEAFLVFWDSANNVAKQACIFPNNPGTFTIPKAVIDRADPEGALLHAIFTHRPVAIENNQRIDLLGTNCHWFDYRKR